MSPRSLLSWKVLLPLGVCTVAFLLPTVIFRAAMADEKGGMHHISITDRDGRQNVEYIDSSSGMSAGIDGRIAFTEDESDVASLSDKAYIEQMLDGREHRIDFKNDGGKVTRRYRIDGDDHPLDANARSWLAKAIPALLRSTGIDAEARARRIHAKGGANAVLAEIELIESDFARREYIAALAEIGPLQAAELDRLLALIGKMESDFERRTSYQAVIEAQELAPPQQAAVLRGVARMGSDFEKRTVLSAMIPSLSQEDVVAEAWDDALDSVGSDFELRTIIDSAAERSLSKSMAAAAIAATHKIDSSFERRTALSSLTRQLKKYPDLTGAWLASAAKVDSDFERRTVLMTLIEEVELDARGYDAVLDATAGIDSDYEQGNVLETIAKTMPADAALLAKYRRIAETMSDYEQTQAMAALGRRTD